jgi:hypothetical protein
MAAKNWRLGDRETKANKTIHQVSLTSTPQQKEYPEELDDVRWPKERYKILYLKVQGSIPSRTDVSASVAVKS